MGATGLVMSEAKPTTVVMPEHKSGQVFSSSVRARKGRLSFTLPGTASSSCRQCSKTCRLVASAMAKISGGNVARTRLSLAPKKSIGASVKSRHKPTKSSGGNTSRRSRTVSSRMARANRASSGKKTRSISRDEASRARLSSARPTISVSRPAGADASRVSSRASISRRALRSPRSSSSSNVVVLPSPPTKPAARSSRFVSTRSRKAARSRGGQLPRSWWKARLATLRTPGKSSSSRPSSSRKRSPSRSSASSPRSTSRRLSPPGKRRRCSLKERSEGDSRRKKTSGELSLSSRSRPGSSSSASRPAKKRYRRR